MYVKSGHTGQFLVEFCLLLSFQLAHLGWKDCFNKNKADERNWTEGVKSDCSEKQATATVLLLSIVIVHMQLGARHKWKS